MPRGAWGLPVSIGPGDMMPYMTARRRAEIMDVVFERLGGTDFLTAWAERSNENQTEFIKLWAKGALRPVHNDSQVNQNDVESLLARLDAGEHAKVIDGEAA